MIKKEEFIVRKIAGETILMPFGKTALKFNGLILGNEVSSFIWEHIEEVSDSNEMTDLVCENFEVDREVAFVDVNEMIEQMKIAGWIE